MRIHVKTKHLDEPADLVWGEYRTGAPVLEPALRLYSPAGEPLMTVTRSLSAHGIYPEAGCIIVHTNGANDGIINCLTEQGIVHGPVTLIPIGDEIFMAAWLTEKARAELEFAMMPAGGTKN